jgi:hypothetical protein
MPAVLVHGVPDIRTLACGSGPVDRTYEEHAMAQLRARARVSRGARAAVEGRAVRQCRYLPAACVASWPFFLA